MMFMARIPKRTNRPVPTEPVPEEPQAQAESVIKMNADEIQQLSPFDQMLDSEYNRILDEQINKALSKMQERFGRMMVQEHRLTEKPRDRLGYNTDDYENLINEVRARDLNAGTTREDTYRQLYDLNFTEMRKLDIIKQEFKRA